MKLMPKEPPKEVVERRVRNRIIDYLELMTSQEDQEEYQRKVPYVNIPSELINQWEDWVPRTIPKGYYAEPVYTPAEAEAILAYHKTWDSVADRLPPGRQSLEEFVQTAEWRELRDAAVKALSVFQPRGRLPED